jgi:hypothetical protein
MMEGDFATQRICHFSLPLGAKRVLWTKSKEPASKRSRPVRYASTACQEALGFEKSLSILVFSLEAGVAEETGGPASTTVAGHVTAVTVSGNGFTVYWQCGYRYNFIE